MGIFYYEEEGFEADDIAGSIAKLASNQINSTADMPHPWHIPQD